MRWIISKRLAPERFWEKVHKHKSNCWLWTGCLNNKGYGFFYNENKVVTAHHYAWTLLIGDLEPGTNVHHKCPNKHCVNPDHLEALPVGAHAALHRRGYTGSKYL